MAYLVLQDATNAYGRITGISVPIVYYITPSGDVYKNYNDYIKNNPQFEDPGWNSKLFPSEDGLCKFYYEDDKKKYD